MSRIRLLVPAMPTADELMPWLRQIDQARIYTNGGPLVRRLEQDLVPFVAGRDGGTEVVSVANATLGLELALGALGLPAGGEILVPAVTFPATATAVCRAGFCPVFADIDADSWLLEPAVARAAAERRRLAAVVPVAAFGAPHEMDGWDQFTADTGIPVLVDAAGAFGSQRIGKTTAAVFSLHATKALGAGEGGFVAARNSALIPVSAATPSLAWRTALWSL